MHLVFAEELVISLLILFCINIGLDILYGSLESRVDACELLFLDLEHRCPVGLVLESYIHVDIDDIASLSSYELGVGITHDVPYGDISALDVDLTVGEVSDYEIILTGLLSVLKGTYLLEHVLLHLVLGLFCNVD